MFESVRFLHPQVLYLALLIPVAVLAHWRHLHHLRRATRLLGLKKSLSRVSKIASVGRSLVVAVLLVFSLMVMLLALSRPQILQDEASAMVRKLDVVFLLDTSPSMQAEDILPSRLNRARQFIGNMITGEELIGRVGLVTFSNTSLILSYLTSDMEALLFFLDYLTEQPLFNVGTNIGAAVESGMEVLEQGRRQGREGSRNRPVMVLVSDGEDHGEKLSQAIQEAARRSLRIYTIGIGSESGGFIPVRMEDGSVRYLEDSHGSRLISRLDETTLRRVAETTRGRFYRAYQGSEIGAALREIVSLEREVVGYRQQNQWVDWYRPLLLIASMALLPAWLLERG